MHKNRHKDKNIDLDTLFLANKLKLPKMIEKYHIVSS